MTPLASLLATALAAPPSEPPPAAFEVGMPAEAALFLDGFDMVWDKRPHRLRRLSVGAVGTGAEGALSAAAQGGTWATGVKASDTPRLRVDYAHLAAPGVRFIPVRVRIALQGRAKGPDRVDVVPERTVEAFVLLPPGVPEDAALAPWITGLDISTLPSHEVGYTPHALAVGLGRPVRDGARVTVPVTAKVEAAPVPDRNQQLRDYSATVVIELVVVVAEGGQAAPVHGHKALQRSVEPVASPRRGAPFRVPLAAEVPEGTETVVAGLSGFSIEIGREGPTAGRYLRALTVGLRDPRHDRHRGSWVGSAAMRMSNAGELSRAIRVNAELDATLLHLPGPAAVSRGSWAPAEGTGCVTWPALTERGCPADPGAAGE